MKNDTEVAHYNCKIHQPILVVFGTHVAQRVCYRMVICYPISPNYNVSALPAFPTDLAVFSLIWSNQWDRANFDRAAAPKPHNRFWWNSNRRTIPEGQPPYKISFRFDDVCGLGEYPAWLGSCFPR